MKSVLFTAAILSAGLGFCGCGKKTAASASLPRMDFQVVADLKRDLNTSSGARF